MTKELMWLAAAALLTGCLWIPYILNRLMVGPGLLHEVGYPDPPTELSPWAARLKKAHANAVENLVVYAPLALAAHAAGIHNPITLWAGPVYFGARVAHALAYTGGIPWLRTIAFSVGWGVQVALGYAILTA